MDWVDEDVRLLPAGRPRGVRGASKGSTHTAVPLKLEAELPRQPAAAGTIERSKRHA